MTHYQIKIKCQQVQTTISQTKIIDGFHCIQCNLEKLKVKNYINLAFWINDNNLTEQTQNTKQIYISHSVKNNRQEKSNFQMQLDHMTISALRSIHNYFPNILIFKLILGSHPICRLHQMKG